MSEDEKKTTAQTQEDEAISKAFGNVEDATSNGAETENNQADPMAAEESKKPQKQENTESAGNEENKQSEKMYTQAEVDAMMAKARRKYQKGNANAKADAPKDEEDEKTDEQAAGNADPDAENADPTANSEPEAQEEPAAEGAEAPETQPLPVPQRDQATGLLMEKLARAEIKSELALAGVDTAKVARAARLIDPAEVMVNGEYSEEKAKEAVKNLLAEWPELKPAEAQSATVNTFSFGVHPQEEKSGEEAIKNQISSIFGNK